MRYGPKKVFILEEKYIELSYEEYCLLCEKNEEYKTRRFVLLHGMLLEVQESEYLEFYREKRRQKYILEESSRNGTISFEMLGAGYEKQLYDTNNSRINEMELVERKMLLENLLKCIKSMRSDEQELIGQIYFKGLTEREYALQKGVCHSAVHKQKKRVLKKMREYLSDWV